MYRLTLHSVDREGQPKEIAQLLLRDLSLPRDKVLSIVKYGQASGVFTSNSEYEVSKLQRRLVRLGAQAAVEEMAEADASPFPISKYHRKILHKELRKAGRAKTNLALLLVMPLPLKEDVGLPSLLGGIETDLEDYLRESDTVISLDEKRVAVLGFCTDKVGADILRKKTSEKFHYYFRFVNRRYSCPFGLSGGPFCNFHDF